MTQTVQIVEQPVSGEGNTHTQRVLIPSVGMLEDKIRAVPSGAWRELADIRADLAREHGADITCPITTRRLLKVIAVIAHSAVTLRDPAAVPFWRVVDPNAAGLDRLAGGKGFVVAQQAKEKAR